jgi:hypothetical protein
LEFAFEPPSAGDRELLPDGARQPQCSDVFHELVENDLHLFAGVAIKAGLVLP